MLNYLFWLTEYLGYYNSLIFVIIAYVAYYLLSNTFMFLGIGIIIGIYISYYMKNYYNNNMLYSSML
jgi:accessory gene regulator protein AgrB